MAEESATDQLSQPDDALSPSRADMARNWGFGPCCVMAFDKVMDILETLSPPDGGGPMPAVTEAGSVVEALSHRVVAPALAEHVFGTQVGGDERLVALARHLAEAVPERAAPHLLLALDAERRGDALTAEAELRRAVETEPGYGPAASELASYAIDRSDLREAAELLNHPDLVQDTPTRRFLDAVQRAVDAPYRKVGRNDPCPCGSGRKSKMCCREQRPLPAAQRLGLLNHKLALFSGRPHRRAQVASLAEVAALGAAAPDAAGDEAAGAGGEDKVAAVTAEELIRHPALSDFAVFDGGIGHTYLDERGELLPGEEREILVALLAEPRRLWVIAEVEPGAGFVLQNAEPASGEVVLPVAEERASAEHAPGQVLLARIARLGSGNRLAGVPIEVPDPLLESATGLAGATAEDLAAWYGRLVREAGETHSSPR